MENLNITVEDLEGFRFIDLQAKFEQMGIPHMWKNGQKKRTMIENAIVEYNTLKKAMEKNMSLEDYKKAQDLQKEELKEIQLKNSEEIVEEVKTDIEIKEVENLSVLTDEANTELKDMGTNSEILEPPVPTIEEMVQVLVDEAETKPLYSRDVLEAALKNIDANLNNGVSDNVRKLLLKKKTEVLNGLGYYDRHPIKA